jgi:hypothetical protein
MPNAIYPRWKAAIMQASANSSLGGNVRLVLVDTGAYTYSAAHEFLSDIPSGARIATSGNVGGKTYTDGAFDFTTPVTFTGVTGASIEAYVIYIDTGTAGTSRLVAFIDTGVTGFPVTPNGGDITFNLSTTAFTL